MFFLVKSLPKDKQCFCSILDTTVHPFLFPYIEILFLLRIEMYKIHLHNQKKEKQAEEVWSKISKEPKLSGLLELHEKIK